VDTGFSMAFPPSMYARIAPRSGLSVKHRIDVGAGVIDSDYRGPVKVLLINNGSTPFEISPGDRIAQMIFERIELPEIQITAGLPESEMRGEGGFGSTGK